METGVVHFHLVGLIYIHSNFNRYLLNCTFDPPLKFWRKIVFVDIFSGQKLRSLPTCWLAVEKPLLWTSCVASRYPLIVFALVWCSREEFGHGMVWYGLAYCVVRYDLGTAVLVLMWHSIVWYGLGLLCGKVWFGLLEHSVVVWFGLLLRQGEVCYGTP